MIYRYEDFTSKEHYLHIFRGKAYQRGIRSTVASSTDAAMTIHNYYRGSNEFKSLNEKISNDEEPAFSAKAPSETSFSSHLSKQVAQITSLRSVLKKNRNRKQEEISQCKFKVYTKWSPLSIFSEFESDIEIPMQ
jgi:hypothetical protein